VDKARYRATLQALSEARRSATEALAWDGLDGARAGAMLWTLKLLDSIEQTAWKRLRATVVTDPSRRCC